MVEIDGLIAAGRWMASRGMVPATSGNLSARVSPDRVIVTLSGGDKGDLGRGDFLEIPVDAPPPARASAETPVHLAIYRRRPEVGAVLHGHSIASTLVSMRHAGEGGLALRGYEIAKAFTGVRSHETTVVIPIFPNTQDMEALAVEIGDVPAGAPGLLLAGHGFYVWGASIKDARRHADALDFLLHCELEKARMR